MDFQGVPIEIRWGIVYYWFLTITHMMYRLVYRYAIIFHDLNFWKIIKNLLDPWKTFQNNIVKNILVMISTL